MIIHFKDACNLFGEIRKHAIEYDEITTSIFLKNKHYRQCEYNGMTHHIFKQHYQGCPEFIIPDQLPLNLPPHHTPIYSDELELVQSMRMAMMMKYDFFPHYIPNELYKDDADYIILNKIISEMNVNGRHYSIKKYRYSPKRILVNDNPKIVKVDNMHLPSKAYKGSSFLVVYGVKEGMLVKVASPCYGNLKMPISKLGRTQIGRVMYEVKGW